MLSGKGFKKIYNLSGGIKGWNQEIAVGPEELGLELFSGAESAEETIVVGFGLEQGLREFYLDMGKKVENDEAKKLFLQLADIEILHQERLLKLYQEISGKSISLEEFASQIVEAAMEGGLTTEEYLQLYNPDLNSVVDILSLAMAIEAQALDLYQRAGECAKSEEARTVLQQIASEEKVHLSKLSEYLDKKL